MPPSIADQHLFLDFAKQYNFAKVRELVEKDIELVNAQPSGRWTALHQACHQGDSSTVDFLLGKGARSGDRACRRALGSALPAWLPGQLPARLLLRLMLRLRA